jgi:AAA15 family ATPase/GTPase
MNYLSYLNIKHFKGIENLELKDLSNINIIVGNNNSGKTSLLEAISLLQSQDSMKTMLKHISRRDTTYPTRFELFLEIFPKEQEVSKSIQINSTINGLNRQLKIYGKLDKEIFKGNLSIKLDDEKLIKKDMVFKQSQVIRDSSSYDIIKIIYITPYDHFKDGLINKTIENIRESDKDKIINLLQMFDSNILDFKVLYTNNKENPQTTYINHKRYGFMPLFSFGDSIKKVLTLAAAVISAKGGILLVDEIETAIHKNMINEVFKWFIDACEEFEVQLICTTHSLEAIDGMIIALEDEIDILSCFRVELYEEKVYGTKFSGNKLKEIRTLLGQDVR